MSSAKNRATKEREEEEELLRKYVSSSKADTQATMGQRAFYFFCALLVTATPVCASPGRLLGRAWSHHIPRAVA